MVFPIGLHHQYWRYSLERDVTKLYLAVLMRNFALGMVSIFEAIYLYLYFSESVAPTLLYYGIMFGTYGAIAPLGGKALAAFGARKSILLSFVFMIAYYACLFFLNVHPVFLLLALGTGVFSMLLFWPAFHTDFVRFSSKEHRGRESGRVNVAMLVPAIGAPALGGLIITGFGFPALFLVVSVVFFASSIPLFYSKEHVETYTDSYTRAFKRVFKKEHWATTVGLFSQGVEFSIQFFMWPLFLFTIAIGFSGIGGITSFALIASSFFLLYAGRLSDTQERSWLLGVGSVWTSLAWILQYFVTTPFSALLAQSIYRVSRAAARVPFWASFYEKAADKGEEADEFIIYNEIVVNGGIGVVFVALAALFFVFPELPLKATFLLAAFLALGFSFVGQAPKIKFVYP